MGSSSSQPSSSYSGCELMGSREEDPRLVGKQGAASLEDLTDLRGRVLGLGR